MDVQQVTGVDKRKDRERTVVFDMENSESDV